MITVKSNVSVTNRKVPLEFIGKSTDEKPIGIFEGVKIPNGSVFYEMDTKTFYMFDEEGQTWYEQ